MLLVNVTPLLVTIIESSTNYISTISPFILQTTEFIRLLDFSFDKSIDKSYKNAFISLVEAIVSAPVAYII
jgi:hypothetical protein